MADETRYGIKLSADSDQMVKEVKNAESAFTTLEQTVQKVAAQMSAQMTAMEQKTAQSAQRAQANARAQGKANEDTANRTAKGLASLANSAEGLASSQLWMVGPQITDVFTQISSGSPIFTTLIQQGGQLRDMFGGIGPAFAATARYITSLVNPFTATAAALAGIAFVFNEAEKETGAFNQALITTNNAVGLSVNQLAQMSAQMAGVNATQGEAAAALAVMAGSTKFGAQNLREFTEVAILMERNLGQAVSATRKQFEDLGKSPVDASIKLNDAYNYLTAATLRQIQALQEQGRATEAAALAQTTYANAMRDMAQTVEQNLGTLERIWRGVKDAAKGAWDEMLGIGRKKTLAEQLREADANIAALSGKDPNRPSDGPGFMQWFRGSRSDRLAEAQAARTDLLRRMMREGENATQQSDAARQNQARMAWDQDASSRRIRALSDEKKLEEEITRIRNQGREAGVDAAEIERQVALARAEAAKKANKTTTEDKQPFLDSQRAFTSELGKEIEKLQDANLLREEGIGGVLRQRAAYLGLSSVVEPLIKQIEQLDATEQDRLRNIAAADARTANLAGSMAASVGETEGIRDGNQKLREQIAAEEQRSKTLMLTAKAAFEVKQYEIELRAVRLESQADMEEGLGEQARADALREQARLLRELKKVNAEVFPKEQWAKTFEDISKGLTDSLFRAAEQGKSIFVALRDSIKGMFLNLTIKPFLENGMKEGMNWLWAAAKTFLFAADGAAFGPGGQITAFADGGVVSRPTLFPFSGGTGLMGEAGPEAIMPLKRGPDGKLGVVSQGGGSIVVNQSFTFSGQTSRSEAYAIVKAAEQQTLATIRDANRRGNDSLIGR